MNSQPLVSVLINNYNYRGFLGEAIDSALDQRYRPLEVVVVDDGSTDGSQELIKSYGERIVPIFKANGGQASAFNAGFAASRGQIVCFLDADDRWLPHKVERVVTAWRSEPEAGLIYHRIQPFGCDQRHLPAPLPNTLLTGKVARRVARSGGNWNFPPTSALSFSKKALARIFPLPESEYRICADACLGDLAPFLGTLVAIDEVLAHYRLHGSNHWSNSQNLQGEEAFLRRVATQLEQRAFTINRYLEKLKPREVEAVALDDSYPYWRLRYLLKEASVFDLASRGLRYEIEPSFFKRVKNVARVVIKGR